MYTAKAIAKAARNYKWEQNSVDPTNTLDLMDFLYSDEAKKNWKKASHQAVEGSRKTIREKVYVRWMGAYRQGANSLASAIHFECRRKDEAACEPLNSVNGCYSSGVAGHIKVGVVLRKESIFRQWKYDCWSERNTNGKLYATRPDNTSDHAEAWAKMDKAVKAIIVYGGLGSLTPSTQQEVLRIAKAQRLPIWALLHNGKIVVVKEVSK